MIFFQVQPDWVVRKDFFIKTEGVQAKAIEFQSSPSFTVIKARTPQTCQIISFV